LILVISSQSYLGKSFIEYKNNKNIISTVHKKKINSNSKYFKLGKSNIKNLINSEIKCCLFYITIKNKNKNKIINNNYDFQNFKKYTKNIIKYLIQKKIHFIYFSTESIYEDQKKNKHSENKKLRPIQRYAKHKLQIENYIKKKAQIYTILRLGRVYSVKNNNVNILSQIVTQIQNSKKKEIMFANDYKFSPLFEGDLNKVVEICINKKITGTYNLCGNQEVSYYSIAKNIIKLKNLNKNLKIKKGSIQDFSKITKKGSISMNNLKLKKKIKFKFSSLKKNILIYLNNLPR
jgi:dTDP-4-dehydrorhamnose reductase